MSIDPDMEFAEALRERDYLLEEVARMRAVVDAAKVYALTGSGRLELFRAVDALGDEDR